MDKHPSITSEQVKMFNAIAAHIGAETAERLFPHVARFMASLDTGVRNTSQMEQSDE